VPLAHAPGSEARPVEPDDSLAEEPPLPQQRSRKRSVPPGASSAIQYVLPALTDTPGSGTSFHAPATGGPTLP
jgi:hypothetical protein